MKIYLWLFFGFLAGILVMTLLEKYKKCFDQSSAAVHEPHPCSVCPVRNACTCYYCDSDELGCQGDYHCPEKVTHFEDPGTGRCS